MSSEREQPPGRRMSDLGSPVTGTPAPVTGTPDAGSGERRGWRTNPDPRTTRMPAGFAEARRETRVPLTAPVRISTLDAETDPQSGRPFFRSSRELCSNVSRGGLFIRTAEPLEPGRRLLVELELPGGNEVEAVGRVAWVKKSLAPGGERGVGVEILGGDRLASLQEYVSDRDRKRNEPTSIG